MDACYILRSKELPYSYFKAPGYGVSWNVNEAHKFTKAEIKEILNYILGEIYDVVDLTEEARPDHIYHDRKLEPEL